MLVHSLQVSPQILSVGMRLHGRMEYACKQRFLGMVIPKSPHRACHLFERRPAQCLARSPG